MGSRLRYRDRLYLRLLSRALSGPAQARLTERGGGAADRPLSYLELGYGQGLSINIHAAANDGTFWGTDFNPVQTAHAMAFAEASGANVRLLNDSFAELAARTDLPEFDVEAVVVQAGAGHVSLAQPIANATKKQCAALNRYICERSRSSSEIAFLASPVTGGGVAASRFEQLFLLSPSTGKRSADEHARFAWDVLKGLNQRVVREGKALETDDENLAEIRGRAELFLKRLPVLEALGIT